MARLPLTSGAYKSRSLIANAQRCVNLYPEGLPPESGPPVPVTHLLTPGLRLLTQATGGGPVRGLYRASTGDLYAVIGATLYYVSPAWTLTALGTIAAGTNPVSMADNGLTLVLVDGTAAGYTVDLTSRAFAAISDPAFYGADRVDYVDTYFLFNRPGTQQFYASRSMAVTFDPTWIAGKVGASDPLVSLIVMHRELWLVGALTTEVWYDSGAAAFPFEIMPGAFVEHGCSAKYSLAKSDLSIFWLSQDRDGQAMVMMGNGYQATRVSNHAVEAELQSYGTVSDAIGFTYQQDGHTFYVLTFPAADRTWAYDLQLKQWHERAWHDANGVQHRHRANCHAFAYGVNVVGDWQNGALYALDPAVFTDAGQPIQRIRTFPHLVSGGRRTVYKRFVADLEVGTLPGSTTDSPPQISLRWSDTRGASWGNPVLQSLGSGGQYLTSPVWQPLGVARDRVFELSWSVPAKTSLNGAFIETEPAGS